MENFVDPDKLASSEASWSGSTLFSKDGIQFWDKGNLQFKLIFEYGILFFIRIYTVF